MPTSFEAGKAFTRQIITNIKHDRILDIGAGSGTYAKMFPDADLTGIEVWEPYINEYNLNDQYNTLILSDARVLNYGRLGRFDVAIAGDVLEHMTEKEAVDLLDRLREVADTVVVSIPLGHHPQGAWEGNEYETHVVDDWTDERVRAAFGEPTWCEITEWIGVYIWARQKPKLNICVYAISKNEAHFIERFAKSAEGADLIMVADTGSSDNTVEECKRNGVTVHEICITPWRFDHARNASIALIPRNMDVCISLDIDEMLEPGWREEIERVWIPGTTRLSYYFDWGAGIKFRYEKIHGRHGYFWHHPCHEYPVFDKRITEVWAHTDMLLVSHHPDPSKSRGQYLDLLELSVTEDPQCPRNAFYYARELSFHGKWVEAIEALNKYLALPRATWPNERCYAMRVMGKCYNEMGDWYNAEIWFRRACSEAPNTREPWCELALIMYRQQRWEECFAYSMRALKITNRELVYTCDPTVWGHWAHDLASISAWNLGLKKIALEQAKLAVEKTPDDDRLRANLKWIDDALESERKHKVPNIIHFMFFRGPKSREFSYINYLAVKIAHEVQKPDAIYFYYNEEPEDNPHWEAMKPYVRMVQMEPPTEVDGVSLSGWPQYQADIVRLQKLYEHGGIYLDTDCLLLKPLNEFLSHSCTMSGKLKTEEDGAEYMSSQTIVAEPRSPFIKKWIDSFADGLKTQIWAWHSVCLPVEIYRHYPDLLNLLDEKKFLPFAFEDYSILEPEAADEFIARIGYSYVVHLWDTIWHDRLKEIDDKYLSSMDNAFARLFRAYAADGKG